jgi:hypothetical protein
MKLRSEFRFSRLTFDSKANLSANLLQVSIEVIRITFVPGRIYRLCFFFRLCTWTFDTPSLRAARVRLLLV